MSAKILTLAFLIKTLTDPVSNSILSTSEKLSQDFYQLPMSKNVILIFLVSELLVYFTHRLLHECRILWSLGHVLHHTIKNFNVLNGARVSLLFAFTNFYLVLLALVFLNFDLQTSAIVFGISFLIQAIALHLPYFQEVKWIEYVFFTPRTHRFHHAKNSNCNFGGFLNIFDRLFGTYVPNLSKVEIGLNEDFKNENVLLYVFEDLARLSKEVINEKSFLTKIKLIFLK